ncbi:DegT/DnrJ/EryC1/StrS aminotransferase family protein [Sphingomonas zeae]
MSHLSQRSIIPTNNLALLGGEPVAGNIDWPAWPIGTRDTARNLQRVLDSRRWSISGPYHGEQSWEQRFAQAFATYTGARFCVPASTGTASLTMALEACGVGARDEVIVPGVSWVASASAVLGVNAVPVLTDVEAESGCLDPVAVERALTPRTKAITVVHLGSAIADLPALSAMAARHGLPLIEDCAQAHGARFDGRHVGTFGAAGTFSMQHSKLLTSGEGGAVITNDPVLQDRLSHLRADGRTFATELPPVDEMELVETAAIMGSNYCLSEFHAAILSAQLEKLDAENAVRSANADRLDRLLRALDCTPQATAPGTTGRAYYSYVVRLPAAALERVPAARLAQAVSAELRLPCKTMYAALNNNRLYQPGSRRRFAFGADFLDDVRPDRFALPAAAEFAATCVSLPHRLLLAPSGSMAQVADAFAKVLEQVAVLA